MGDPALLDGLLVNLFTNSIQAVPEPDAVEITLTCTQNQLLYRDNGPGLPQDARRLLLEGVWTSELLAKGGLGLPLIRAYCTAMGWQISQPEGERGLLFTLPTCLCLLRTQAAPGVAAACTRANSAFTFPPRRSLPTLNILLVSLQQILRVFCPPFLRPGQKMRFFYFMALLYGQIIVK